MTMTRPSYNDLGRYVDTALGIGSSIMDTTMNMASTATELASKGKPGDLMQYLSDVGKKNKQYFSDFMNYFGKGKEITPEKVGCFFNSCKLGYARLNRKATKAYK